MPTYVKKADGTDLFLPGYGRVRAGDLVTVSDHVAAACSGSLVLADLPAAPGESAAPVASSDSSSALPIAGYDDMNAKEAIKAIGALEYEEDLLAIKAHEEANKKRKTVLAEIEEILED